MSAVSVSITKITIANAAIASGKYDLRFMQPMSGFPGTIRMIAGYRVSRKR
jgi:hypothetical protein